LLTPLLLMIGCLLTALALLAGWAQWQLLDNDAWAGTSAKLLDREEIRDRVAVYLVDELERSSPASIPAGGRNLLVERVSDELDSSRSKRVWRAANREAHRELVRLIEDDSASSSDVVTLDLRPLIRTLSRTLEIPVPPLGQDTAQMHVVAGDQVRAAREGVDQLQRVAAVLLIAAPLVLFLAVAAATGWRRRAAAGAGIAVALAGGIVLLARALVGAQVVEALTANEADRDAVGAAWSAGTSGLAWAAGAAIVVGLVVAVAANVAGRASADRGRFL
jgi:hypothetical protein